MKDLIDRQEAIKTLEKGLPSEPLKNKYTEGITVGLGLAITWVEQLPSAHSLTTGDTISRQDAMEEISKQQTYKMFEGEDTLYLDANDVGSVLASLQSVQPDIIRCENCIHSEHWYGDKSRCFLWNESGIGVFNDGFCSYAERKEGEADDS